MLEYLLAPLVESWTHRGYGFELSDGSVLNHVIWCDNIFTFAKNSEQFLTMSSELGDVLAKARLYWKPSSLEVMAVGDINFEGDCVDVRVDKGVARYKDVDSMVVLGRLMTNVGGLLE